MNVSPLASAVVRSHDLVGGGNKGDLLLHETVQRKPTKQSCHVTLSSMCTSEQITEFCIVQLQRDISQAYGGNYFSLVEEARRATQLTSNDLLSKKLNSYK